MPIFAGPTGGWPAFLPSRCWRRTSVSNALLLVLAVVSYSLGDMRAAIIIVLMVLLAIITAFIQEHRSNEAAARLHAMVKTTAAGNKRLDRHFGELAFYAGAALTRDEARTTVAAQ